MESTELVTVASPDALQNNEWIAHLGATLKENRVGRFTVEQLAEHAGVSAGLISQIERGIGNPAFATLNRLAHSLDLPLSKLFSGPIEVDEHMLVRRADRRRIEIPSQGIVMELIVPDADRKLGAMVMTIPAHFDGSQVPHSHKGEECVVVQSGLLTATIAGQTFDLGPGDSLTYDSALTHWWSNGTDSAAVMLAISTPPSFGRAH